MDSPWHHPKFREILPEVVDKLTVSTRDHCHAIGMTSDELEYALGSITSNRERNRAFLKAMLKGNAASFKLFCDIIREHEVSCNVEDILKVMDALVRGDQPDTSPLRNGSTPPTLTPSPVPAYLGKLWQEVEEIPLSKIAKGVLLSGTYKADFANRLGKALGKDEIQEMVTEHIKQKRATSFMFSTAGDGVDNLHGTLHWAKERGSTTLTVGQVLEMLQDAQPAKASTFAITFSENLQ